MTTKLTAITTSYSSFENDQVLTAAQLNTFLNYFDDQDRMSRICLSGVGIVCGFKVNFKNTNIVNNIKVPTTPYQVEISQGCGITTDGDLIHLLKKKDDGSEYIDFDTATYTTYVPFVDDKANYRPFFYKVNPDGPQIPMWELLSDEAETPGTPISAMPDLNDKVVLLYLESYNEDVDLCVGLNCDNLGINQVQKLRVLVVSQEDADYILSQDPMFNAEDLFSTYMDLSDVAVPRVVLNEVNTLSFAALRDSYKNAITSDAVVDNMKNSFTEMLGKVGMAGKAIEINTKLNTLFGNTAVQNQPMLYFQYRYDALKDVVDTYMEMKELFLHSNTDCCPDIHSFPKHLMLGKLIPTADDEAFNRYRHSFYKSPLLGEGQESYAMFQSLVDRLMDQLNTYIATNIPRGEIKITPSQYGLAPLGDGAIPYYYNLQASLLKNWNYEKTQRNKQRRNLSYHTTLLDPSQPVQKPLKYNLEPYNFLRIEGQQGALYQEAMDKINTIKYNNGLSFDLKALGITISPTETINIEDYACEFADLTVMLNSLKAQHECILGNASYYLSSYSTVRPNWNEREVEFYYPLKPVRQLSMLKPASTNIVLANLNTKADVAGKIMAEAFRTNDGCSANDIVAQINVAFGKINFTAWDKTVFDTTIRKPAEILANSLLLLNYLPTKLPDFTRDRIAQYAINARNICGLARRVQGVNTGELNTNPPLPTMPVIPAFSIGDFNKDYNPDFFTGIPLKPVEPAMINLLMNQLSSVCCSTAQLETIMDEIEARKNRILLGLKLSKFIETHPGLEHLAGTKQGGTFVLVYLTNPVSGIAANTVVADFSLPYMCCSDCNSVNFIMPRPAASLTLSQDRFCIGNDTSPLLFTPYPLNGVIKADRVVPGMTINGTQLLINPALIPNSAIGVPIYFTVNGQVTGANITIYRSPQVNFNVPTSPTTQTLITFQPIGTFEVGTTYLWNFGDGQTSAQKITEHQFAYPVNEDNKVTVSLTVTPPNGACPTTVRKDITFLDYQVTLDPMEFCNNDTTVYPFTVTPSDADITITGDGVVPYDEVYYGFQPSAAESGEVQIYVNGSPWMEVTVNPDPEASIFATIDSENLTVEGTMSNVEFFVWSFENLDGDLIHANIFEETSFSIPLTAFDPTPVDEIVVKLTIQNECSAPITTQVNVPMPIDFAECSIDSIEVINNGQEDMTALMASSAYADLLTAQKAMCNEVKAIFTSVITDLTPYLEGTMNTAISNTLSDLLFRIHGEIVAVMGAGPLNTVRQHQVDSLLQAYSLGAYLLYPSILRCQNEVSADTTAVHNLFTLLVSHLLSTNSDSFTHLGLDIDPDGIYAETLAAVMVYRTTGSFTWNSLNQVMGLIG